MVTLQIPPFTRLEQAQQSKAWLPRIPLNDAPELNLYN